MPAGITLLLIRREPRMTTQIPLNLSIFASPPRAPRAADMAREEQAFYDAHAQARPWHALVVPGVALAFAVLGAAIELSCVVMKS